MASFNTLVGRSVTFTDSTDLVNLTSNGFSIGNIVIFKSISTTTGISINTPYYVINPAANSFQLAADNNGSALPLTNDGTGSLYVLSSAINTTSTVSTKKIMNLVLWKKFSGINALSNISTKKIMNLVLWKKFSGLNTIVSFSVNSSNFTNIFKFSGLNTIITGLSVNYTKLLRTKFSGVKLISYEATYVKLKNLIDTKFTFAGLSTIKSITAVARIPLISEIYFSGLNTISKVITTKKITNLVLWTKFSGVKLISYEATYVKLKNLIDTKFTFAGLNTIKSITAVARIPLISEIYFSGLSTIKPISYVKLKNLIDTKFTFAGLSTIKSITAVARIPLISEIYFSGLSTIKSITAVARIPLISEIYFSGLSTIQVKTYIPYLINKFAQLSKIRFGGLNTTLVYTYVYKNFSQLSTMKFATVSLYKNVITAKVNNWKDSLIKQTTQTIKTLIQFWS